MPRMNDTTSRRRRPLAGWKSAPEVPMRWVCGVVVAVWVTCVGPSFAGEKDRVERPVGSPSFQAAWRLYQDGKPAEAALQAVLDDAAEKKVDRFNAAYTLAVLVLAAGDAERALTLLSQADALLPGRAQVALRRAEVHLARADLEAALRALEEAKKTARKGSPLFVNYQVAMARCEALAGKPKAGIARLEPLQTAARSSWEIPFSLGILHESQDAPAPALAAYKVAIERLPEGVPCAGIYAYQRWAALTISSDTESYGNPAKVQAAIEHYEKFLARAPQNRVPDAVVETTRQAVEVLRYFLKPRG